MAEPVDLRGVSCPSNYVHARLALEAVAEGDEIEVLLDGGIRRGGDVAKALALGARAVMIGRAYLWGLAANGQAGVENVLDVLRGGLDSTVLGLGLSAARDLRPDDVAIITRNTTDALNLLANLVMAWNTMQMQQVLQGGPEYGNLTITRFYALHVFVLPISLTLLLVGHLALFRKHGVTPPAAMSEEELRRKTQPFWPNQLFLDVLAMFVCAAALVSMTYASHGAELFAPADPASNFVARPEWYFLFLYQLLKYFEGPLQIIATVLLPGAVAIMLFALPWIDRARSRRPRDRAVALSLVGLMMAGVTALTVLAMAEDASNESYQHGLEVAEKESHRARTLALEGVPAAGGVAVFDNDPKERTRKLFKEHCATCHTIEGHGGAEAPSFDDYGGRAWLAALIRDPRDPRFYGGTKGHNTMEPLPVETVSDAELAAIVEYVLSLGGPEVAGMLDAGLVAQGKALWDGKLECSGCHEIEAGKSGTGPTLTGRGSAAWIARIIHDSSQPDLYGDTAEMPKFAGKLSPTEIEALAQFIGAQRRTEAK